MESSLNKKNKNEIKKSEIFKEEITLFHDESWLVVSPWRIITMHYYLSSDESSETKQKNCKLPVGYFKEYRTSSRI